MKFRLLKATEIDCRVATVKQNGFSILLYKDARCDMNILDETVGAMNWKREHSRDNANCTVSLWDEKKQQWISKEDTGTESYTEKEKGLASDSFKRACFNWGIGRELYTAPFIWIKPKNDKEIFKKSNGNGFSTNVKMRVQSIEYDKDNNIKNVVIIDNEGVQRFPNTSSKNHSNSKKTEELVTLEQAIEELKGAKNLKELHSIWSKHKKYQPITDFSNWKDVKKDELQTKK